jgi:hypothetical protein
MVGPFTDYHFVGYGIKGHKRMVLHRSISILMTLKHETPALFHPSMFHAHFGP